MIAEKPEKKAPMGMPGRGGMAAWAIWISDRKFVATRMGRAAGSPLFDFTRQAQADRDSNLGGDGWSVNNRHVVVGTYSDCSQRGIRDQFRLSRQRDKLQ